MARQLDHSIRAQLLQKSLALCVRHGFNALSLRALAQEIGTSHRMLIYHFGSRENLFEAVLAEFRQGQLANVEEEFSRVTDQAQFGHAVKKLWLRLAADEHRLVLLSSLEIQLDALRQGHTRATSAYLRETLEDWLEPLAGTLQRLGNSPAESRITARLVTSAGRGLLLDLLAAQDDPDSDEVKTAFCRFIDGLLGA